MTPAEFEGLFKPGQVVRAWFRHGTPSPTPAEFAKARLLEVLAEDREVSVRQQMAEVVRRKRLATFGEALAAAFVPIPLPPRHFEEGYWLAVQTIACGMTVPALRASVLTGELLPAYRWRFR